MVARRVQCELDDARTGSIDTTQRRFDRKLERKLKIKFFACLNIIYYHGCHTRLPLGNNCRGTWNKNIVKRCRIIQETILKQKEEVHERW